MENYKIKIISIDEGIELGKNFPSLSYCQEFFEFTKNLTGGFLAVYEKEKIILMFPVNFLEKKIYAVFKDYTEPCFLGKIKSDVWSEIIVALKKEFGFEYIEFYFSFISQKDIVGDFKRTKLSSYVLRLDGEENEEKFFAKFNKKTRNEIRKSFKASFNFKIGSAEDLDSVYDLYVENMKRHSTPIRAKSFFENLLQAYGEKCKLFLAYDKGVLAGVNLALVNNGYLRLSYNFSRTEYWPQCINNFLYFRMIEWGKNNRIKFFDFGPSLDSDKSHVHFKLGFGGEKVELQQLIVSSKKYLFKRWLEQKRYNLKIRLNKLKK